jgi:hypothetical protein
LSVARGVPSTPQVPLPSAGPAAFSRRFALHAGLVLVVSAALAGALATLTSSSGAPPQPERGQPLPAPRPEIHAVPAAEAALFAVLRSPRTAADAFAPLHAGSGPLGADPALARGVRERRGGLSAGLVSVIPANGAVCLRIPAADAVAQWWCQPTAAAARGELLAAVRPGGRLRASNQLIVGLVPDGVRSVQITTASGERRVVAVVRNVYDTQIYAPQRVSITLPGRGTVRYLAP